MNVKKIEPSQFGFGEPYIHIHTWHNDWGNDSIDSHENYDLCKECAKKFVSDYIERCKGTMELELSTEQLSKNETYCNYSKFWNEGARLLNKEE